MDDIFEKCARIAPINEIIADLPEKYEPGDYRFLQRYPQQYIEYWQIATAFLRSNIPEVQLLGLRMGQLVSAIDETDTVFTANRRDSWQAQSQIAILGIAFSNMIPAISAALLHDIGGEA